MEEKLGAKLEECRKTLLQALPDLVEKVVIETLESKMVVGDDLAAVLQAAVESCYSHKWLIIRYLGCYSVRQMFLQSSPCNTKLLYTESEEDDYGTDKKEWSELNRDWRICVWQMEERSTARI